MSFDSLQLEFFLPFCYCRKSDPKSGEVPVAFVVKSPGGQTLEEADVLNFVAKQVN